MKTNIWKAATLFIKLANININLGIYFSDKQIKEILENEKYKNDNNMHA